MARTDKIAQTLERFACIDTPTSRRRLQTVSKYGITLWEYERLGFAQDWKCAGCEAQFSGDDSGVQIKIDHCHASGVVRGLLCHSCNVALGWARDNSRTLRRLAGYLDATQTKKAGNT